MRRWHRYRSNRCAYRGERRGKYHRLIFLLIGMAAMCIFLDVRLKPTVRNLTENLARQTAVAAVNDSVMTQLGKTGVSYDDLVHIERDADGRVLAITTDTVRMNQVKAQLTSAVQDGLTHGHIEAGVPLGTLLGSELLHGRGPNVPLVVTLAGNVTSDFKTSFEAAGINQTRHQIYLEIHTSIYSFIPGVHTTSDITTSTVVAETVIVGEVPQFFLGG